MLAMCGAKVLTRALSLRLWELQSFSASFRPQQGGPYRCLVMPCLVQQAFNRYKTSLFRRSM
jgi:hypothetical protein